MTREFSLKERGPYGCVGPCAAATYFYAHGMARSDAGPLRWVRDSAVGQVLDYNPMTHLIVTYQEILFFPGPVGHWKWLLFIGALSMLLFLAGY